MKRAGQLAAYAEAIDNQIPFKSSKVNMPFFRQLLLPIGWMAPGDNVESVPVGNHSGPPPQARGARRYDFGISAQHLSGDCLPPFSSEKRTPSAGLPGRCLLTGVSRRIATWIRRYRIVPSSLRRASLTGFWSSLPAWTSSPPV
jgi:hypothetical protein